MFTGPEHADVAVQVEQRKRVAVLEHGRALARTRGGGQDIELILNLNYVVHAVAVPGVALALASNRSPDASLPGSGPAPIPVAEEPPLRDVELFVK